jgi:hypothetical protein
MYETVKNVVSFIHLFMILMKTWLFEFSFGWARQTTGFNLVSCVLSVKWLTSTLMIRLNWAVLPKKKERRYERDGP